MKPSKGFWIVLAIAVAAVLVWFGTRPCNAIKQRANMKAAEEYAAAVRPRISTDAKFANVTLQPFTGGACGGLLVNGSVASDEDLQALRAAVNADSPRI